MSTGPTTSVIEHLRRAALLRGGAGLGDGELLGCFLEGRDEAALAALVRRHGPMVWGVCRRLLGHHDAEDAFQATFLVLVAKAASVVPREMVGNWLYGVAHQTALQARRTAVRRAAREVQVSPMPESEAARQDPDVGPLLDQELSHLPDIYRAVIVLCDLEDRTRNEVARQLGVPEGTVAGRLARARAMLAKRLTRRGVTLSGGALAAVLAQNVASAALPASVLSATIGAANLFAVGQAAAVAPAVAALTQGVLKAMLVSKLKGVLAVVLVMGLMATGAAGLAYHQERAAAPSQQDVITAWGTEVGGLQAGLSYLPGQERAYCHGDQVRLLIRVRNVSNDEMKFQCVVPFFENQLTVTDAAGKRLPQQDINDAIGGHLPSEVRLAPGEQIVLHELKRVLRPTSESGKARFEELYATGKVGVQYERVFGTSGLFEIDPRLRKLATGKLDLEIADGAKARQTQDKDKGGFTAWGEPIGGLQAGLGYPPGQRRAYRHGEMVKLVIRVRNVGKDQVKFSYLRPYIEHALTVTDSAGKLVPQPDVFKTIGSRLPSEEELAPGKEIKLHEFECELRPASESGSNWFSNILRLYGTGKVNVEYQNVLGSPEMGAPRWQLDPVLSKLATGKLELETKPAPEDGIIEQIEKRGGKVERDHSALGKPVTAVLVSYPGPPDEPVDDDFLKRLALFTKLRKLHLPGGNISDEGLKVLANFKDLNHLDLAFTQITDAGLKRLGSIRTLEVVRVSFSKVTQQGIAALQEALPNAKIIAK